MILIFLDLRILGKFAILSSIAPRDCIRASPEKMKGSFGDNHVRQVLFSSL